jgi:hypothetical protein
MDKPSKLLTEVFGSLGLATSSRSQRSVSHVVGERLTIAEIKLLGKQSDGQQFNFALVLIAMVEG